MGDIVELENLYKINSRVRITEFIYSTDQNGTSEYPGFEVIEEEKEDEEGEE